MVLGARRKANKKAMYSQAVVPEIGRADYFSPTLASAILLSVDRPLDFDTERGKEL